MTTVLHDTRAGNASIWLRAREMWATLAITVMWIAVIVDALVGPDITSSTPGGDSTTIPSAVAIAMFATIGTWFVSKYGLKARDDERRD